jgi:hypothetical protein
VGYLETSLAERIALYFWRLGRVARHEREVVAIGQESLAEEIAESRREKAKANRLREATSDIPVFGIGNDMSLPAQNKCSSQLLTRAVNRALQRPHPSQHGAQFAPVDFHMTGPYKFPRR